MNHIVVVGSINLDLVFHTERLPGPGETLLCQDFSTHPGGKGANQALAAQRLGSDVRLIGNVGDDVYAGQALALLRQGGVDLSQVIARPGQSTGMATITVDPSGQNTIVVHSGANYAQTAANILEQRDQFAWADAVILQFEIPPEVVLATARLASRQGCKVIVNPAPARDIPDELYPLIDALIPNQPELQWLTHQPVDSLPETIAAARQLNEKGARVVVVTLGEAGALLVEAGQPPVHVPAFQVEVQDSVAAGDTFVAGFTVAWLDGLSLAEAVRFGNAAGALAATRPGAQTSLPWRKEVEGLFEAQNLSKVK